MHQQEVVLSYLLGIVAEGLMSEVSRDDRDNNEYNKHENKNQITVLIFKASARC